MTFQMDWRSSLLMFGCGVCFTATGLISVWAFKLNTPIEPIKPVDVNVEDVVNLVERVCTKGAKAQMIQTAYSVTTECFVNRAKK